MVEPMVLCSKTLPRKPELKMVSNLLLKRDNKEQKGEMEIRMN